MMIVIIPADTGSISEPTMSETDTVRAATVDTGPLRAIGKAVHSGRQMATSEARIRRAGRQAVRPCHDHLHGVRGAAAVVARSQGGSNGRRRLETGRSSTVASVPVNAPACRIKSLVRVPGLYIA
jgi:hypothetical protein